MAQTKVSLIISVYNDLAALNLILKSICRQSFKGTIEVIIAEDKQCLNMQDHVHKWRNQYIFPIKHIHQEDIGFRKCKILNQAIREAGSEYLIFIDGDCILHKHFIREHLKFAQAGRVVYGRRVMLSAFLTRKLIQLQKLYFLNFFILLLTACKRLDAGLFLSNSKPIEKIGFWGHNWSIHARDIKLVGGFDESYNKAGIGEDTDIEWRLQQKGIKFIRIKNRAIQYHLYHKSNYPDTKSVEEILAHKKNRFQSGDHSVLQGSLQ